MSKEKGLKKFFHPFNHRASEKIEEIEQKLEHTKLRGAHIKAVHVKHKIGKFTNLFNANHRHDEEHEKETDAKRSKIAESHRFNSFAPERDGNLVKWYVDGRDYFWAVAEALEQAKETIYIADWWLSPELFLKRPPYYNQQFRLDQVLKRRAEAGVKIYISVYKEVSAALTCNSQHTKKALMGLIEEGQPGYGNIKVMRHPDHNVFENASDMTFYWAHHEKFIVIDYAMAFIGGLDLCYGRWDEKQHPLSDAHPSGVQNQIFPGQDYNNNRIMDFESVDDWKSNKLNKLEFGRMPWHDVAMGVIGPAIYDIAEHFVLRWNFVKREKYKRDERYDWLTMEGREGADEDLIGVQRPKFPVGDYVHHPITQLNTKNLENRGTVHAQLVRSSGDWSMGIEPHEQSIQNAYCELIRNAKHFVYIENQFFITATGKHDESPVHNQIGAAIVDAIVSAAKEERNFKIIIVIPAIPGFAGDLRDQAAAGTRAIMDYQFKSICRGEESIFGKVKAAGFDPEKYIFFFNLRSYDRINVTPTLKEREKKSGMSYMDLEAAEIDELEAPPAEGGDEKRRIAAELRKKYMDEEESVGKGDQGGVIDPDSIADDAMLTEKKPSEEHWEGDPEDEKQYFFQEELYIHAKLCIIDDRIVLCGSSNINDRSQLGFHDSELTIVLQDTDEIDTMLDGKPYKAARLAHDLRSSLWREHLGLLPPQALNAADDPNAQPPGEDSPNDAMPGPEADFVSDPLCPKLWDEWFSRATTNTEVFRSLFHADPDDNILTFEDYDAFTPNPKADKEHKQGHLYDLVRPVKEIRAELDRVKGHLVWMQLKFLENADMAERGLQINSFTESVYT
ncbi:phospholipase D1 [Pyrenophora tritici-repentis]|uniref:Phospholipase n=1 Tax=Pyrenophora tritici-repentis TaxID=45151 RepID=A0A2W1GYV7_9PLEO|nr:phospholipase protein [Pyrenophora tritici-repentis]KAF7447169.1 phospholipase protein [Pyrenophora tritici-repentis]KAF7569512.1 phospholipase D1 [Pyrenophora tritici-repentis]KAI0574549.1 phospholipase protein [Pyrenophora tritici-repentis]KAI0586804.1 phospholipase protein [Pyrenophora tritici-repentis]